MGSAASTSSSSSSSFPGARAAELRRSTDPDSTATATSPPPPSSGTWATSSGFSTVPQRSSGTVRAPVAGAVVPPPAPPPPSSSSRTPGAYSVIPTPPGTPGQRLRVQVPSGASPGSYFEVESGGRRFRVRCPPHTRAGSPLYVTVPAAPAERHRGGPARLARHREEEVVLTETERRVVGGKAVTTEDEDDDDDPAPPVAPPAPAAPPSPRLPDTPGVARVPGQPNARLVPVPLGVVAGQVFRVTIDGQRLQITCPPNLGAGMFVRVVPPPVAEEEPPTTTPTTAPTPTPTPRPRTILQPYEVNVPPNVRPGQSFYLMAGGQRVRVTCPPNVGPGRRIRFELPVQVNNEPSSSDDDNDKNSPVLQLRYETKDGWTRTVRLSDKRFHWIRTNDDADDDDDDRPRNFNLATSAFCRRVRLAEGVDPRARTGYVTLVPASEASSESCVRDHRGREIADCADLAAAQARPFAGKVEWFRERCSRLRVGWAEGHVRVVVRRDHLLGDSLAAVMSLGREDLRRTWRFHFTGEEGMDAGGLAREWFELVSQELFNADRGLWSSNAGNQMCNQINAAAELTCGPEYRTYYRFLGRLMGKALFDGQLIKGHMVQHLYKHLLGWPVTFDDLELIDEQYHANMKKMTTYSPEELEALCLDFTYTEQHLGALEVVELVPDGKERDVDPDNLAEYLELCTKYRLLGRIRPHLTELLLGFLDVVPEPLTTVFDYHELELLMCGLPEIDLEDWRTHTVYAGAATKDHRVVEWFWDVVANDLDEATRAKLLQFATGTSGVPSQGFAVLQGNDGDVRKFCINGVTGTDAVYPRSHTCFNRIDLPMYKSKKELHDRLKAALEYESIGFSVE